MLILTQRHRHRHSLRLYAEVRVGKKWLPILETLLHRGAERTTNDKLAVCSPREQFVRVGPDICIVAVNKATPTYKRIPSYDRAALSTLSRFFQSTPASLALYRLIFSSIHCVLLSTAMNNLPSWVPEDAVPSYVSELRLAGDSLFPSTEFRFLYILTGTESRRL